MEVTTLCSELKCTAVPTHTPIDPFIVQYIYLYQLYTDLIRHFLFESTGENRFPTDLGSVQDNTRRRYCQRSNIILYPACTRTFTESHDN